MLQIKYLCFYSLDLLKRGLFLEFFRTLKLICLSSLNVLQLHSIYISLSHKCNANCIHCYEKFSGKNYDNQLSTDTVKNILDQFHALGGCKVYFCSGEVTLREDLAELIRYARSKRMITSITSNGITLTENKLDKFKLAGLNNIIISIDSADPKKHDKLRGAEGCFEKAKNALIMAKAKGFRVKIWTYVTASHINELEKIDALGKQLGIHEIFVFFALLSGHLYNEPYENLTFQQREYFRKKFNKSTVTNLEFASEKDTCLGGGSIHVNVMPSGEVTFCPPVPFSYGNIYNHPLKDCLIDMKKDYVKFFTKKLSGQCPVNFLEYRENCNAKFIYKNTD